MTVFRQRARPQSRGLSIGRIVIGLIVAAFALISYFGSSVYNPVTEEDQHVAITQEQEIALGLQSAPEMTQEYGGLYPDQQAQNYLDQVCERVIGNSQAAETGYPFECQLLDAPDTINAFALPGGPLFITTGLYKLLETEGQLAGVMAHEVGHVVARHSAQQIARMQLAQGLSGAAVIATYDPNDPRSRQTAQMAALISQVVNMKFGRDDELQSDRLGVRFMANGGYDPRSMIRVMEILDEASGGQRPPEFFSTHPNPENRIANIQQAIDELYPNGVPEGLEP
jgi:predicted Zn-dependent protease